MVDQFVSGINNLYEKLISDSMPIAVIDALEVIEINEQCRYLA